MQVECEEQENVARTLRGDTLWVRFVFVDHAGIPKTKAVHRDAFARRARAGVGLAKGVLALDPSGALHPVSGLSPVGEVRLVPDLSSLTPLPFARGQAMVCCDMTEPDARTPWDGCPGVPYAGSSDGSRPGVTAPSPPTRPSSTCVIMTVP